MAVAGEVHPFMGNHVDNQPLDTPVYTDWLARMREYYRREGKDLQISKDAAMLAMEDLCLEAGVELLYHHSLADVIANDGHINAVVLFSKSGFTAALAAARNCAPKNLDGIEVREQLVSHGARL